MDLLWEDRSRFLPGEGPRDCPKVLGLELVAELSVDSALLGGLEEDRSRFLPDEEPHDCPKVLGLESVDSALLGWLEEDRSRFLPGEGPHDYPKVLGLELVAELSVDSALLGWLEEDRSRFLPDEEPRDCPKVLQLVAELSLDSAPRALPGDGAHRRLFEPGSKEGSQTSEDFQDSSVGMVHRGGFLGPGLPVSRFLRSRELERDPEGSEVGSLSRHILFAVRSPKVWLHRFLCWPPVVPSFFAVLDSGSR